jgi:pyrroline-5-carboxylate reductase
MKLGVIGCGKMATALVKGGIAGGVIEASEVLGVARSEQTRFRFQEATGGEVTEDVKKVVEASDVILLATKPNDLELALEASGLGRGVVGNKLIISVVAGVDLETMDRLTNGGCRIVRTMPNTPSLVGKGAAAFVMGDRCGDEERRLVRSILDAVGISVEVPERLMNAVTGLSGSGPAFVYLVIEALADGGVRAGLSRADAIRLASQTVSGAAEMVLQTGEHPAVLKDIVASPGGTTIAGLALLEEGGLRFALMSAVMAAARRAEELGKA